MKKLLLVVSLVVLLVVVFAGCAETGVTAEVADAACAEMGIAPKKTELRLLYSEFVDWLGCECRTYVLTADGAYFIVDAQVDDENVKFVDVVEQIDYCPKSWAEYCEMGKQQ